MSFHRVLVVAVATLLSIGMTSIASASCCGWGYSAPVAYAAVTPAVYGGCGNCGAPTAAAVYAQPVAPAPIAVNPVVPTSFGGPCCGYNGCGNCGWSDWSGGCGGCGVSAWGGGYGGGGYGGYSGCGNCGGGGAGWGSGCGNCGGCGSCGVVAYAPPSVYVVNQGPVYSGAAVMNYSTYTPETAYVPATDYPYVPGSGYGYGYGVVPPYAPYYRRPYYGHPRYAYRTPYVRHYYGPAPRWRHYP
jgi:hypothetical protein